MNKIKIANGIFGYHYDYTKQIKLLVWWSWPGARMSIRWFRLRLWYITFTLTYRRLANE